MDKKVIRRVFVLFFMFLISLFTLSQTQGFENIRPVQFLLIFAGGALIGVAIALLKSARRNASTMEIKG